jgi:hypothetical protein
MRHRKAITFGLLGLLLTVAVLAWACNAPVARASFKTDPPMCAQQGSWGMQACRRDDGTWFVCGPMMGCQNSVPMGPTPMPGATPAPGLNVNGSAYVTGPPLSCCFDPANRWDERCVGARFGS